MKKRIMLIILITVFVFSGCEVQNGLDNYPTLYITAGDYANYTTTENHFIIIRNKIELQEILNSIETYNHKDGTESHNLKEYFKNNEIGYLDKADDQSDYKYLFNDDSNLWFKNNRLVFCSVTTGSSGYKAEVTIEVNEGNTVLNLDKFNNFDAPGADEIKTFNFFVPLPIEAINILVIILDNEPVEYKQTEINLIIDDYEYMTDEELEYAHRNYPKYPYDLGLINGKYYKRIVSSSSTADDALKVVTDHFTDNRYSFSTNTVVEVWIDIETELFYGVYVKWEHNSSGKLSYYDEYVITFKKEIYDCKVKRVTSDEEYYTFNTQDEDQIKTIMDYRYYNNSYNIAGSKLLYSEVITTDNSYIYQSYGIKVVFGDWGLQDTISLIRTIWTIDKTTGKIVLSSKDIIKTIYVDGKLTHY